MKKVVDKLNEFAAVLAESAPIAWALALFSGDNLQEKSFLQAVGFMLVMHILSFLLLTIGKVAASTKFDVPRIIVFIVETAIFAALFSLLSGKI